MPDAIKRDEGYLSSLIAVKTQQYHEATQTEPAHKLLPLHKELKALKQELLVLLRGNAKACPECKVLPFAFKKRTGQTVKGEKKPPIYEVGCLNCKRASRSYTPDDAVKMWNAEDHVPYEEGTKLEVT